MAHKFDQIGRPITAERHLSARHRFFKREFAICDGPFTLWQGNHWGQPAVRQPLSKANNDKSPLAAQLDHFVDVMEGAPPLIDVADAERTLDIALRIESQLQHQIKGASDVRSALG